MVKNETVFGYQGRWDEYRYKPSLITGVMRSILPTNLDAWHLSQEFGSAPVLNYAFIEENPPLDRVLTLPDEKHIIFDSVIEMKHARIMPVYNIPGLGRL